MMLHDAIIRHEPDSTLFPAETDHLLGVMGAILSRFAPEVNEGSFVLYGQKFGEAAQLIMSFNLPGGTCYLPITPAHDISYVRSDQLAAVSVDDMLRWPKNSGYLQAKLATGELNIQTDEDIPSGIYVNQDRQTLVVRATYGRFICSCFLKAQPPEASNDGVNRTVLYTVAQTLQRMDPQDEVLQEFQIEADDQYAARYNPVLQTVRQLIDCRELPEIQAWAAWHAAADEVGTLTRFFE